MSPDSDPKSEPVLSLTPWPPSLCPLPPQRSGGPAGAGGGSIVSGDQRPAPLSFGRRDQARLGTGVVQATAQLQPQSCWGWGGKFRALKGCADKGGGEKLAQFSAGVRSSLPSRPLSPARQSPQRPSWVPFPSHLHPKGPDTLSQEESLTKVPGGKSSPNFSGTIYSCVSDYHVKERGQRGLRTPCCNLDTKRLGRGCMGEAGGVHQVLPKSGVYQVLPPFPRRTPLGTLMGVASCPPGLLHHLWATFRR